VEGLCVGERIIIKWMLEEWDWRAWTGSMWLRIETGDGLF
jgi:hypothetical protein